MERRRKRLNTLCNDRFQKTPIWRKNPARTPPKRCWPGDYPVPAQIDAFPGETLSSVWSQSVVCMCESVVWVADSDVSYKV